MADVARKLVAVHPEFNKAVDISVQTATKGHTFACEAIGFCEQLAELPSDDPSRIKDLLTPLILCAEEVRKSSEDMRSGFRIIRGKLYQVGFEVSSMHLTLSDT